jgi:hypothetical protein
VGRDLLQWTRLRGGQGLWRVLWLGPIKELVMVGIWLTAPFLRRVSWRGRWFRVGAGTRLYAEGAVISSENS